MARVQRTNSSTVDITTIRACLLQAGLISKGHDVKISRPAPRTGVTLQHGSKPTVRVKIGKETDTTKLWRIRGGIEASLRSLNFNANVKVVHERD